MSVDEQLDAFCHFDPKRLFARLLRSPKSVPDHHHKARPIVRATLWRIWPAVIIALAWFGATPWSASDDFSAPYSGVEPVQGERPLLVILLGPDDPHWHPTIHSYALNAGRYVDQFVFDTLSPGSRQVHFETSSGHFLAAEAGGGGDLVANRASASFWETFQVIDVNGGDLMSGDSIQLEAYSGNHYVTAQGGGNGNVTATSTVAGSFETFMVQKVGGFGEILHGDTVTLTTYSGHLIEAVGGGGAGVQATGTLPSASTTFVVKSRQFHRTTRQLPRTHRFQGHPTTVNSAAGSLQSVFCLGEDSALYQTFHGVNEEEGAWRPWSRLPGTQSYASAPAGINSPDGTRMHLFAVGTDGSVYQIDYNRNISAWEAPVRLTSSQTFQATPAAVNTPDGAYMHVFATGTDRYVYQRVLHRPTQQWGPWTRLPGSIRTDFGVAAIASPEGDKLTVLATGTDGRVHEISRPHTPTTDSTTELFDPSRFWGFWFGLPSIRHASLASGPSVMNTADGDLTIVQASADDAIYEIAFVWGTTRRWGDWTRLAGAASRPSVAHRLTPMRSRDDIRADIFGPDPSVRGYFQEVSYGRFTYREAYVTGWLTAVDDPSTVDWDESTFDYLHRAPAERKSSWVVAQVEQMTGFRFADYDTNSDGRITEEELAILWVYPGDGDARGRGFSPRPAPVPSLPIGIDMGLLVRGGARMSRGTIAHELAHQTMNLPDLYPQVGSLSLMGYQGNINHLGPWSRMKLGWLDPQQVTQGGQYVLRPIEQHPDALIIARPGEGTREYFMLENRWTPGSYEEGLARSGLGVWRILEQFNGHGDWGRKTIHVVSPEPNPTFWSTQAGSPVELEWSDGTPSGITLRPSGRGLGVTLEVGFAPTAPGPCHTSASLRITTTSDSNDGVCDEDCSLREAIIAANANDDPTCVLLQAGEYWLTIPGGAEGSSLTGDLDIKADLTLVGAGSESTTLRGSMQDRVLHILNGAQVSIAGLKIRGGSTSFEGGGIAIQQSAEVSLTDVTLESNTSLRGGGVWVQQSSLDLENCHLRYNVGTAEGGGVFLDRGTLAARMTEIESNRAGNGGGIFNSGGTATVDRSLIFANAAEVGKGGGIRNFGLFTLQNSTVTANAAALEGGGLWSSSGHRAVLVSSTLAGNSAPSGSAIWVQGDVSYDGMLIGGTCHLAPGSAVIGATFSIEGPSNTCGLPGSTNLTTVGDLGLSQLGAHGGPTRTLALLSGSPAIDPNWGSADTDTCPAVDQRGVSRPQVVLPGRPAHCDAGAFELSVLLRLGGDHALIWDPVPDARAYHVLRGDLANLVDDDGDGSSDVGYGECVSHLGGELTATEFVDDAPSPGQGLFYLVQAETTPGRTVAGYSSSGVARLPTVSCP